MSKEGRYLARHLAQRCCLDILCSSMGTINYSNPRQFQIDVYLAGLGLGYVYEIWSECKDQNERHEIIWTQQLTCHPLRVVST